MSEWKQKLAMYGSKAVRIGSDMAEVVVHMRSPTVVGGLAVAARAINTLSEITAPQSEAFFREWDYVSIGFAGFLLGAARKAGMVSPLNTAPKPGERGRVFVGEVHGVPIGWVQYESWVDGPWTRNTEPAQAMLVLGRLAWETLGPAIKIESSLTGDTLAPDLLTDSLPSQTANEVHALLDGYAAQGHTRSALLYGEAGTGKSHIMRQVAKLAGGYSLRVKARHLSSLRDIARALVLLRPSAVLIDDLDRLDKPEQVLGEIEEIKGFAKLFLCSVNRVDKLDPAVLRPGRFDEYVEITKLDDAVLEAMIGDVPEDIAARLRKLPVAYIDAFQKRRAVKGDAAAIADVEKLESRAATIRELMGKDKATEDSGNPETKPSA